MHREEHPHDHTTHGHDMRPATQEVHDPAAHVAEPAPGAATIHTRHDHMAPTHDKHAGHTPAMFRDRFWLSLLFTLPILYFDAHFQTWFGYQRLFEKSSIDGISSVNCGDGSETIPNRPHGCRMGLYQRVESATQAGWASP
jgi:hypothetical protein